MDEIDCWFEKQKILAKIPITVYNMVEKSRTNR